MACREVTWCGRDHRDLYVADGHHRSAAELAAYHSKARAAGTVAVSCTEARHVSKPRGAKPGTVAITRERMIKTRPATDELIAAWRVPG